MTNIEIPQELREAWRRVRGESHAPAVGTATPFPISAAIIEREQYLKDHPEPGTMVEGQGISLGIWRPVDLDGKSLGKVFQVYAAPYDLSSETGVRLRLSYDETVREVAELEDWCGFDGTSYESEYDLYNDLKKGTYSGGWIIPPLLLLVGIDRDDKAYEEQDCLSKYHDIGDFHGQFETNESENYRFLSQWYWSSTEYAMDSRLVFGCFVQDCTGIATFRDDLLRCRPVRLVEIKKV